MKIDEMIKRENFFDVLTDTLKQHYNNISITITRNKMKKYKVFYVYEKINAIVSPKPSKEIIKYLETEYFNQGSFIRRILVMIYIKIILNTNGFFSSHYKCYFTQSHDNFNNNILIFPCDKKIRVFDFSTNKVDVILKKGFPSDNIKNEIEFRTKHINKHIHPIIKYGETWYQESIIDGKPLARILNDDEYINLKIEALKILKNITQPFVQVVNEYDYISNLIEKISVKTRSEINNNKNLLIVIEELIKIFKFGLKDAKGEITLTLSHGDFHHGNIWIENKSNKIIIIDWETIDIRSEWYDPFTLFGGLREVGGIINLVLSMNGKRKIEYIKYASHQDNKHNILLVLLEDLYFRITDLERTPYVVGINSFEIYCNNLLKYLNLF